MKKLILLFGCIFILSSAVSASHLMGGQITVSQLNGMDYLISMHLYRDTTGITIAPTADFTVEDINSSFTTTIVASHSGSTSFFNGVQSYEYSIAITFPGPGQYRIHWENCCRNFAILNMSNPANENLHLMTEVTVYGIPANSTPVFLNPPATLAQKNSLWQYNPLPFDIDGDSLTWVMETPLGGNGIPVTGYTLPHGNSSNPFTLNSLTGEITWLPDSNGHWEASFRVEEFRNGVKIGEIRRDMQIIVVDDTSNYHPPLINNGSWPVDAQGNFAMNIAPGTPFYLTVTATDLDNDQLSLTPQGEPMLLTVNPAQWSITNSAPGTVSGILSWTPQQSQLRSQPYLMAFRVTQLHNQNTYTMDETVLMYVTQSTGTEDMSSEIFNTELFPNPSGGDWNLNFRLNKSSDVRVEVSDITGKKVATVLNGILPAGMNLVRNSSNLEAGYYLINVVVDEKMVSSSPLIVK